ncbi:MAG: hypothetical protein GY892_16615, partial [Shimia sp.]|nr:hypothetical protein [Shimia sp.]
MKNVLILGFSVTAEAPGFVEKARDMLGENSEYALKKVGLGGLQPYHLRQWRDERMVGFKPTRVVSDLVKHAVRLLRRPPEDYQKTLQ